MLLADIITRIDTIGELYFVCEMGKFLYKDFGEVLDLEGVVINEELTKVAMWDSMRIAYYNKYIVGIDIDEDLLELDYQTPLIVTSKDYSNLWFTLDEITRDKDEMSRRYTDTTYDLITPKRCRIAFEQMTDGVWVWSYAGKIADDPIFRVNSETFYRIGKKTAITQSWVSLLAWVAVQHIKKNNPQAFIMLIQFQSQIDENVLDYILDVINRYSDFFDEWFEIRYDKDKFMKEKILEAEYKAWYRIGKDLGYTQNKATTTEKRYYLKKEDIQVGDAVLLYKRQEYVSEKGRGIDTCNMGVVRQITEQGVLVDMIFNHHTLEYCKEEWELKPHNVQEFYKFQMPFAELNHRNDFYSFIDLGINHHLSSEIDFIVDLDGADDELKQTILYNGERVTVYMGQNDLIYWILKEHNVEFNEERFKAKYFEPHNRLPLWDIVQAGGDIEEYKNTELREIYFERKRE